MHIAEKSVPVLDDGVLSELKSLCADVVAEIFELFMTDVPNRLGKLHQAIDKGSCDGVLREAHGLKGRANEHLRGQVRLQGHTALNQHDKTR